MSNTDAHSRSGNGRPAGEDIADLHADVFLTPDFAVAGFRTETVKDGVVLLFRDVQNPHAFKQLFELFLCQRHARTPFPL